MKKPCKYVFHGLAVSSHGFVSPCCGFRGDFGHMDVIESIVDTWKTNPLWRDFRKNELEGNWYLPGCQSCKIAENSYFTLKGQDHKIFPHVETNNLTVPDLQHLDIAFGNTCNLACVMCTSRYSSSWYRHDLKLSQAPIKREVFPNWSMSYHQIDQISAYLPWLRSIEVKGGEPLYDKKSKYFLKKVSESGQHIDLNIFTNFTIIDEDMINILGQLPRLNLQLSVDGTGNVYDWIRGFKFTELEKNIYKYLPILSRNNQIINFNFTASVYNIHNISQFINWIERLVCDLNIKICPHFNLIAMEPDYISPYLTQELQYAIEDIDRSMEIVTNSIHFESESIKSINQDLDTLKKVLINDSQFVSSEQILKHKQWHQYLVEMRGWDIWSQDVLR